MFPKLKIFAAAVWVLTETCVVEAQSPSLSYSIASSGNLVISWPSNFTTASWQLASTVNLASHNWQPVPVIPFATNSSLVVSLPLSQSIAYFRLQQAGAGGCLFQATPPAVNVGGSSTLSWCPVSGYTYYITPGPGNALNGSLVVSPTNSTVYSLIASNAQVNVFTNNTTVIVGPCGWLQVTNLIAELDIDYELAPSTASYNFNVRHGGAVTFHMHRGTVTDTDAYFIGFATSDPIFGVVLDLAYIQDREDDKSGPTTFTTTEVGKGHSRHDVSFILLHLTCDTFDFSYNIQLDTTEVTSFGTSSVTEGVGSGVIATRPLSPQDNRFDGVAKVLAIYPPTGGGDYYVPASHVGTDMFNTGTVAAPNAGQATIYWGFYPEP